MTEPTGEIAAIDCPVCRAGQPPRDICRRCGADLALFVHAVASRQIARRRLDRAVTAGDHEAAARLRGYLAWLGGARGVSGGAVRR